MAGTSNRCPGFGLTRTAVPHLREQTEGDDATKKALHLEELHLEQGPLLNTQ